MWATAGGWGHEFIAYQQSSKATCVLDIGLRLGTRSKNYLSLALVVLWVKLESFEFIRC